MGEIIKKIDELDELIRKEIALPGLLLSERNDLKEARDLIQKALTLLLRHQ